MTDEIARYWFDEELGEEMPDLKKEAERAMNSLVAANKAHPGELQPVRDYIAKLEEGRCTGPMVAPEKPVKKAKKAKKAKKTKKAKKAKK